MKAAYFWRELQGRFWDSPWQGRTRYVSFHAGSHADLCGDQEPSYLSPYRKPGKTMDPGLRIEGKGITREQIQQANQRLAGFTHAQDNKFPGEAAGSEGKGIFAGLKSKNNTPGQPSR